MTKLNLERVVLLDEDDGEKCDFEFFGAWIVSSERRTVLPYTSTVECVVDLRVYETDHSVPCPVTHRAAPYVGHVGITLRGAKQASQAAVFHRHPLRELLGLFIRHDPLVAFRRFWPEPPESVGGDNLIMSMTRAQHYLRQAECVVQAYRHTVNDLIEKVHVNIYNRVPLKERHKYLKPAPEEAPRP